MENLTEKPENMFLTTPLGALFFKVATPMILIMLTNGLFNVVDGWFIGQYIGAEALSAVTLIFPLYMIIIALGTLVAAGFSSVFSRYLGASDIENAETSQVSALALSVAICGLLILLFVIYGDTLTLAVAKGSKPLADMGYEYLSITITYSGLFFISALLSDSFRCQGKMGVMTFVTVLTILLNILFDYLLVVELEMGVAGSAYGTALAQTVSIALAFSYYFMETSCVRFRLNTLSGLWQNWGSYLALGAPISLSYVGVSILSGCIIFQLQVWDAHQYGTTSAAYGIMTRLFTFGYMPLLGMTLALQAIVGNNSGAHLWDRSYKSLKISIILSAVYCASLQFVFQVFPGEIASLFVDSPAVISEVSRIFPVQTMLYVVFGPMLMFPAFFQAIGDARRAALLGLLKLYGISVPMILLLPLLLDENGIWIAGPLADALGLVLTAYILYKALPRQGGLIRFMENRA